MGEIDTGYMLLLLLLVLIGLPSYVAPDYQGDALFDMRDKLIASPNQLNDWNPNQVNPCTWTSVICDGNNNVVTVTLASIGLNGTLSAKVGVLKFLTALSLAGNRITGPIPAELGNLTSLTSLNLENNQFSGEIPSSIGNLSKLQILILSQNILSGGVPESLTKLTSLNDIRLAFNNLTGQIPDHLFEVPRYNFTGNNLNCGAKLSHSCVSSVSEFGGTHSSKLGVILGIIGGVGAFISLGIVFLVWKRRRHGYRPDVFVDVAGG